MNAYPTAPHAWDRTRSLARRLGVDLPRAVVEGWLTRRDLDQLVGTCAACGKTACRPDRQTDLPGRCATAADLDALRL